MSVTIDGLENWEEFLRRLVDPQQVEAFAQNVGYAFGNKAVVELGKYPGPSHRPVIWASEKQRRWYFASRREAGLPFEYDRLTDQMSSQLGMNWEIAKMPWGAVVGSAVPYAQYVQGFDTQSAQHKATGWRTQEQAAETVIKSELPGILDREMKLFFAGLTSGLGG